MFSSVMSFVDAMPFIQGLIASSTIIAIMFISSKTVEKLLQEKPKKKE